MKKQDLLKRLDRPFLDRLFGFCYARTRDSHEAEALCSDVTFAMVKAAGCEGEVENPDAFLWKIARNVYADFSERKRQAQTISYVESTDPLWDELADDTEDEQDDALLSAVYRQIAFLTKIYRETVILYYLEGCSTAQIARRQGVSETAVRQRLFSARNKLRNEVNKMTKETSTIPTPMGLKKINYCIWGNGNPGWGDPCEVCTRQFSKQILSLCSKKPRSAEEIADILNIPTLYVEEELAILEAGKNGEYGLLRKDKNGKYGLNIILLDRETMQKAAAICEDAIPTLCDLLEEFIGANEKDYLAFPYQNRKVTLNLVLWQQMTRYRNLLSSPVTKILQKKQFAGLKPPKRPFTVYGFGYEEDDRDYGGSGLNGTETYNICGYQRVFAQNSYGNHLKKHFDCGENFANMPEMMLAIRAVEGLAVDSLSENEKEAAAKGVETGILYREGDTLYTKILVIDGKDEERIFDVTDRLYEDGRLETIAAPVAEKLAALIRETVPEHLLPEWRFFCALANLPVDEGITNTLIERGILTVPEGGLDAEGVWMILEK